MRERPLDQSRIVRLVVIRYMHRDVWGGSTNVHMGVSEADFSVDARYYRGEWRVIPETELTRNFKITRADYAGMRTCDIASPVSGSLGADVWVLFKIDSDGYQRKVPRIPLASILA